jgi:hypothetical protein
MTEAKCPACSKIIRLQELTKIHAQITCPHCHPLLEYVHQFPPIFDWADDPMVFSSRRIFNKLY